MRPAGWLAVLLLALSGATPALAADQAALQRGAQMFMDQCAGCHSLKYLRYQRLAQDLDLSPAVIDRDLARFDARLQQPLSSPMSAAVARLAFGKMPPDLSLEEDVRGRVWLRRYLSSFYLDPSSPRGWNNPMLPGLAMPDPFWRQQGIRLGDGHGGPGAWLQAGDVSPQVFARQLEDLLDFLQYAAAPDAVQRHRLGPWVLLFLAVFTALAWALKRAWWQDVKRSGPAP